MGGGAMQNARPASFQDKAHTWTPELVRDRMIEAVRWARYNAGSTGPSQIRSSMPEYTPTLEDHLAYGWGLPEKAEGVAEAERSKRVAISPERVDEMIWVLDWCRLYLAKDCPGDAVMLNLWLRCKVHRANFEAALKSRGYPMSRRHADRMKDRALSTISKRLDREGTRP